MEYIHQPDSARRLGDYLNHSLSKSWTYFRAAVAFVKRTGTRHIAEQLRAFSQKAFVELIVGIDHRGTSTEGLLDLLDAVNPSGRIIVFHNPLPFTFHPKLYIFKSPTAAEALIGSGNLTEGGMYTNYESTVQLKFDLSNPEDQAVVRSIDDELDQWSDTSAGTAHRLDPPLLKQLTSAGLVLPESALDIDELTSPAISTGRTIRDLPYPSTPFVARSVRPPPRYTTSTVGTRQSPANANTPTPTRPAPAGIFTFTNFVITLQTTDVGTGQTTSGTSRRSPEIFIPLAARNDCPEFWGWPNAFSDDPRVPGKKNRTGVRMRFGTDTIIVNMMTWPIKRDFRLRSESLRSAANVEDILHLEKAEFTEPFEYYVQIISADSDRYPSYLVHCNRQVRNSRKTYGYY